MQIYCLSVHTVEFSSEAEPRPKYYVSQILLSHSFLSKRSEVCYPKWQQTMKHVFSSYVEIALKAHRMTCWKNSNMHGMLPRPPSASFLSSALQINYIWVVCLLRIQHKNKTKQNKQEIDRDDRSTDSSSSWRLFYWLLRHKLGTFGSGFKTDPCHKWMMSTKLHLVVLKLLPAIIRYTNGWNSFDFKSSLLPKLSSTETRSLQIVW